jgi:transcriptional regulator with XRE-family HTH domain
MERTETKVDSRENGSGDQDLDGIKVALGARIRTLRGERELSARALAESAGVSSGFLSQVEHGRVMPSVATLIKLATALETRVGDLFDQIETGGRVIRSDNRPAYSFTEHGVRDELVSSDPTGEVEVLLSTMLPGATTGDELYTHGTRVEVVYVVSGTIGVRIGPETVSLGPGDSLTFSGETPHGAVNEGDEPAVLVWIAAPARY